MLLGLADRLGLTDGLSEAMAPTRERRSPHDPGHVLGDLALMLAGGALDGPMPPRLDGEQLREPALSAPKPYPHQRQTTTGSRGYGCLARGRGCEGWSRK